MLKGGLALELRVSRARTTKDIDLRLTGATADVLTLLQQAGRTDLGDWLTFLIEPDRTHPLIEGEGAVYTGQRFLVQAQLGGARFGDPFGLDVGVADVLTDPPEVIQGSTFLQFVDVPPAPLRVYPRTAHVSEKVHAYTLPRERPNPRVKDLPDLAILASSGPFEGLRLRKALEATFGFRRTHALPTNLPSPPEEWEQPYARMAATDDLPWSSLVEVLASVRAFLDPVLAPESPANAWDPAKWAWTSSSPES